MKISFEVNFLEIFFRYIEVNSHFTLVHIEAKALANFFELEITEKIG